MNIFTERGTRDMEEEYLANDPEVQEYIPLAPESIAASAENVLDMELTTVSSTHTGTD
jgi:hypothetical protein